MLTKHLPGSFTATALEATMRKSGAGIKALVDGTPVLSTRTRPAFGVSPPQAQEPLHVEAGLSLDDSTVTVYCPDPQVPPEKSARSR